MPIPKMPPPPPMPMPMSPKATATSTNNNNCNSTTGSQDKDMPGNRRSSTSSSISTSSNNNDTHGGGSVVVTGEQQRLERQQPPPPPPHQPLDEEREDDDAANVEPVQVVVSVIDVLPAAKVSDDSSRRSSVVNTNNNNKIKINSNNSNTTTTTTNDSTSNCNNTTTFDYIIVGGGTSAMGILYGLLQSNNNNNNTTDSSSTNHPPTTTPTTIIEEKKETQHNRNPPPPPLRIAVLERGDHVPSISSSSSSSSSVVSSTVTTTPTSTRTLPRSTSTVSSSSSSAAAAASASESFAAESFASGDIDATTIRLLHRWCAASFPTYLNHPIVGLLPSVLSNRYNAKRSSRSSSRSQPRCQVYEGQLSSRSTGSRRHNAPTTTSTTTSTTTTATTKWSLPSLLSSSSSSISFRRLIDVSTGYGVGGTTLINAGLVVPPSFVHDFPSTNFDTSDNDDNVDSGGGDWPDTISSQIMNSVRCITLTMHHNQCLHSSFSKQRSGSIPSNNNTTTNLEQPSSLPLPFFETTFPSHWINVPCAVSSSSSPTITNSKHQSQRRLHRVSYYESLVAPLLQFQQQQQQQNNSSSSGIRFDITILTGCTVERILVQEQVAKNHVTTTTTRTATVTTTKYPPRQCCIGVEVWNQNTGTFQIYKATKDVILCTGTIVSPVLLLNAGIGTNRNRNRRRHSSYHQRRNTTRTGTNSHSSAKTVRGGVVPEDDDDDDDDDCTKQAAGVGCKLQDHVLLPRILLTRPDMSSTYNNALNGVRAITNLLLSHPNENKSSDNNNSGGSGSDSDVQKIISTKAQINLMDSAAYLDLIPIMGAAPFRYQISIRDENDAEVSKREYSFLVVLIKLINLLLYIQYHFVQLLLHVLIHYTPIFYISKYCIKVIAIFVMNGQSYGSITVSPRDQCDSTIDDNYTETTTSKSLRIRDVKIHINLGYLSNPNDLQRFRHAFAASIDVYRPNTVCELFPGPLVWNYCKGKKTSAFHARNFEIMAHGMVLPYFHWIGTCAMKKKSKARRKRNEAQLSSDGTIIDGGKEVNDECDDNTDDWVVDEHFRVRGVDHLRICDASIFPSLISAPTALTCAALGHLLAKMMIDEALKEDAMTMKKRE